MRDVIRKNVLSMPKCSFYLVRRSICGRHTGQVGAHAPTPADNTRTMGKQVSDRINRIDGMVSRRPEDGGKTISRRAAREALSLRQQVLDSSAFPSGES